MKRGLSRSRLATLSLGLGVVLLLGAGGFWLQDMLLKPQKVFERMLVQSVATTSVARNNSQNDGTQQLDVNALQTYAPAHQLHSISNLKQGEGTEIVTENIATPDQNFVRYESIKTNQLSASGKAFDFSSVLGIWGQAEAAGGENSSTQLYTQSVILPFVHLNAEQRKQFLGQIVNDQVYEADFNNVKKTTQNGRPVYAYAVSVKPIAYIKMLKTLAGLQGIKELDSLDPNQYANVPALSFEFEVDALSAQLTKINYSGAERSESFGSYGAIETIALPDETIPLMELQTRLQQLQ